MQIKHIMTTDIATCQPDTNLAVVAKLMWDRDCGIVPVIDAAGTVAGVITDRDICIASATRRALPEPAATLLGYVNDRDVARLGPLLMPHIGFYVDAPALSPSRSPEPSVPVLLLHGRDDNVIPAVESQYMADRLRGRVPVRLLLTNLLSHAETDQSAHLIDVLRLGGFWGDLLER